MNEVCKLCGEGGKICGNCGQRYITTTNDKWIELLKKANEHGQLKQDRAELVDCLKLIKGYIEADFKSGYTDNAAISIDDIKYILKKLGE